MSGARLSMRKIREALRLKLDLKRSNREIANSCRISTSTVAEILWRFSKSNLCWPLPENLCDLALEEKLYPKSTGTERLVPNWAQVHQELKGPHVTRMLLWQEYKRDNPSGFNYSWFCESYENWFKTIDLAMRQPYQFGDKCFVDYAGQTIPIINPGTGEAQPAQIFVGVMGASNYTYAEAVMSQELPSWINSHVKMLEYFGGVPAAVIPDNLKSGVSKPNYYEPDINRTYQELAEHYGFAVLPARIRKPRDKAKVENGVLLVERWILAALRKRTVYSLSELNEALKELLVILNGRNFQKLPYSRKQLFEDKEKPALKSLPATAFAFGSWKKAKVPPDYHVEADRHYYSVPWQYVRQQVEIRLSFQTVEIFLQGLRIASHKRSSHQGGVTTIAEHMPSHHRQKAEWTPERMTAWAGKIGKAVEKMVEAILESRPHPEQGFRSCFGLFRLGKVYGKERLESACRRAGISGAFSYQSVKSILEKNLDQQPMSPLSLKSAGYHENVRGARYYSQAEMGAAL